MLKISKIKLNIVRMMIDQNLYYLKGFIVISAIFILVLSGQSQTVIHVEKLKCEKESGYSIGIFVFYDSCTYKFSKENRFISYFSQEPNSRKYNTVYRAFNTLPDSIKLVIVRNLLLFENDTSLCCYPVQELPYDWNDGRCGCPIGVKYKIQVDALFIISAICFERSRSYSCVPMLIDTISGKCVNEYPDAITEVYNKYHEWFNDCLQNGKIGAYFPFNNGRFVWKNGKR